MVFKAMLDLLGDNKQLPYYAAERRIDLFINMFLEDILTAFYKKRVDFVAPEFPLKLGSNNQADKLDYLCAFEETKQPIFVELKTDVISFSRKQAKVYCDQSEGWPACIEGLKKIIGSRGMRFSYREKYFQLIKRLIGAGLVDLPDKWADESFKRLSVLVARPITRKAKGEFSRDLIQLSTTIHARWNGEAKLLYLVPQDVELERKIKRACGSQASILNFSEVGNQPISPSMSHATEFHQLVEFLRTLK